jgi:AcrR family transcriptional regulator
VSRVKDALTVVPGAPPGEGGPRRRGRRPDPALAEERRRQILDAARRVFIEKGYQSATMSDVARAAGLGKGTLYWYWRSKEDILYDLMVRVHAVIEQGVRDALTTPGPIAEKFQRVFESLTIQFMQHPGLMRLFRATMLSNEEALRERFAGERSNLGRRVSALTQLAVEAAQARGEVSPDLDARLAAQVGYVFMEGIAITAMVAPDAFNAPAIFTYAMEQFFRPLLAGKR